MVFPFVCRECNSINGVDLDALEIVPKDKIISSVGYTCKKCKKYNHLHFTTLSLQEALSKMKQYDVRHKNFRYHFAKTLRKSLSIQEKYG